LSPSQGIPSIRGSTRLLDGIAIPYRDKKAEERMSFLDQSYCFRIGAVTRRIWRVFNNEYAGFGVTVGQTFILFDLLDNDEAPSRILPNGYRWTVRQLRDLWTVLSGKGLWTVSMTRKTGG
jgi:hypothetical protein